MRLQRARLSSFAAPGPATRGGGYAPHPSTPNTTPIEVSAPNNIPPTPASTTPPPLSVQPPHSALQTPLRRSFLQRTVLDRFSSSIAEKRQQDDIFLLERFGTLALTLKSCIIPEEHPLNDIADHVRGRIQGHFGGRAGSAAPTATAAATAAGAGVAAKAEVAAGAGDGDKYTQRLLAALVADLTPAPSPAELLAQEKAKKVSFLRRMRNRLSFRRATASSSTATATATATSLDSSAQDSAQAPSSGAAKLKEIMQNYWPLLAHYGSSSLAHTFVSYDLPMAPISPRPRRGYELAWQFPAQTALRCGLLRHYLLRLSRALQDGDIKPASLEEAHLVMMCDAVLRGSSSERLYCHLHLFDDSFSQGQLQDAFYILFEPEVEAVQAALMALTDVHPDVRRAVPKFSSTYLLDRFELNVKSRCLFAWSDPNYKGFNQLNKDLMVPLADVLKSRQLYFPEGLAVGHQFANDVTADQRLMYHDRRDLHESLRNGAVFFVICVVLDGAIQGF